jgi:hypothetical protein
MIDCCSAGAMPDGTKEPEHHHHDHQHEHDDGPGHEFGPKSGRWEVTDGYLYLLRELSNSLPAEVSALSCSHIFCA